MLCQGPRCSATPGFPVLSALNEWPPPQTPAGIFSTQAPCTASCTLTKFRNHKRSLHFHALGRRNGWKGPHPQPLPVQLQQTLCQAVYRLLRCPRFISRWETASCRATGVSGSTSAKQNPPVYVCLGLLSLGGARGRLLTKGMGEPGGGWVRGWG